MRFTKCLAFDTLLNGRSWNVWCCGCLSKGQPHDPNRNNGVIHMRNLLFSYLRDESGAAAAEYALILTIIGTAMVAAVAALVTDISTALHNAGTVIAAYTY